MLLPRLGALLAAAGFAHAAQNTSPFFLISSDPLPSDSSLQTTQYVQDHTIEEQLTELFSSCDKHRYTFIEQHGVAYSDLQAATRLSEMVRGAGASKVVEVPHVVNSNGLDVEKIMSAVDRACTARGKRTRAGSEDSIDGELYDVDIAHVTLSSKAEMGNAFVAMNDDALTKHVRDVLDDSTSAVVIYISRPATTSSELVDESKVYEMDEPYPEAPHIDLKRDTGIHRRQDSDDDMQAGLPLFEKYQFLSPPIFMGLSVSILLLFILSVGLRAISGLEVSYMAFNKEMGPQAQRSKQQ